MIAPPVARLCFLGCLVFAAFPSVARAADIKPVTIEVPEKEVWLGQRASFFVHLNANGSFAGSASFSLPQLSRVVIVKVGNPVVSNKDIDGESWFVQTHEFALFSQKVGVVDVPEFEVRFSNRKGFTGPATDHVEKVPSIQITTKAPPGREQAGFLVTAEQIDIDESWDLQPGAAKVGTVYRRTITQKANQMTGMALAPPPLPQIDGIRIYVAHPEVSDKTERGEFSGTRRDTITYLLQQPGTLTVPAIKYVWWNPKTETYGSKTLPAVSFDVAAPPPKATEAPPADTASGFLWLLGVATVAAAAGIWQRQRIRHAMHRVSQALHSPQRIAARNVRRGCRNNDPVATETAWLQWQNLHVSSDDISPDLRAAVLELHRHLYGLPSDHVWNGVAFHCAFVSQCQHHAEHQRTSAPLPPLNPTSCER